jgi:hypothetical protein
MKKCKPVISKLFIPNCPAEIEKTGAPSIIGRRTVPSLSGEGGPTLAYRLEV